MPCRRRYIHLSFSGGQRFVLEIFSLPISYHFVLVISSFPFCIPPDLYNLRQTWVRCLMCCSPSVCLHRSYAPTTVLPKTISPSSSSTSYYPSPVSGQTDIYQYLHSRCTAVELPRRLYPHRLWITPPKHLHFHYRPPASVAPIQTLLLGRPQEEPTSHRYPR